MPDYLLLALDGLKTWLHYATLPAWVVPMALTAGVGLDWIAHMDWKRSCEATEFEEWLAQVAGGEEDKHVERLSDSERN